MVQSLLPAGVEAVLAVAAGWILTYLLHSTAFLGGAWVLDRWVPIADDARLRSWLWKGALLGGVVTATVTAADCAPDPFQLEVSEAEKVVLEVTPAASSGAGGSGTAAIPASGVSASAAGRGAVRLTSSHAGDRLEPVAWLQAAGHDWPYLLVLAALAAAVVAATGKAWRLWRFSRLLRVREPVESPSIRRAMEKLGEEDEAAASVRLTRCDALASPVALPGGEICLPPRVRELSEQETKALLAHEVTHVRRRDPATLLALAGLEAVLALQPLNRLARRRLAAVLEARSDDRVKGLGLGAALASTLVTVGRWVGGNRAGRDFAGLAREDGIEARVRRLLDEGPEPRRAGGAGAALTIGAGAAVAVAAALSPGIQVATLPHPPHVAAGSSDGSPAPEHCTSRVAGPGSDGEGETSSCPLGPLPSPAVEKALADGPGAGLYLAIEGVDPPLRLRLRPGRRLVRWYPSSGDDVSVPLPPEGDVPDGRVVRFHLADPAGEEHVVYVPPTVRRLAIVVNGRLVGSRTISADGDLPRLVLPEERDAT